MKRPTLQSVAERAKVSSATVSMVLNGRANLVGIKPATQALVRAAAAELNYQANPMARGLAGQSTQSIGITWSFSDYHPQLVMRRKLQMKLQKRGYRAYLSDSLSEWQRVESDLDDFQRRGVDGLIIQIWSSFHESHERVTRVLSLPFPKVAVVDRIGLPDPPLPCPVVVRDHEPALRAVFEHFVQSGRKRIVMVTAFEGNREKTQFIQEAIKLPAATQLDLLEIPSNSIEIILESTGSLPDPWPFDAAFCTSDELAAVLMTHLRRLGLRIPQDVAVIGFNNNPFCKVMDPPLASVSWASQFTLDAMTDMLFNQLTGLDQTAEKKLLQKGIPPVCISPLRFIWRESAGGDPPAPIHPHATP